VVRLASVRNNLKKHLSGNMNWYKQLFGVHETLSNYNTTQKNFAFDYQNGVLTSLANGQSFVVGRFETPTLSSLRERGMKAVDEHCTHQELAFKFSHVAQGDVFLEHAKYPGALFQAASQFNCLEFPNAFTHPENGVTNYMSDRTQGPACSLACAAGTVVRNYFVNVGQLTSESSSDAAAPTSGADYSILGQRADSQINNLHLLEAALRNDRERYFNIRNGYTFTESSSDLERLTDAILAAKQGALKVNDTQYSYEELKGLVKIGLHRDVGVTFATRYQPAPPGITVTQAYCSALSCAYSGVATVHWEAFARLVLEAAYEATLWAGVLNALRPPPSADTGTAPTSDTVFRAVGADGTASTSVDSGGHRNKVFLTFLGGGVFGNDMRWICDSIGRAMAAVAVHGAPIEVIIAHYRAVNQDVVRWVDDAYERELQALH
jgi:hypothetical protein